LPNYHKLHEKIEQRGVVEMLRRILIADTPEGAVTLKRILLGRDCTVVSTMSAAVEKLDSEGFDLIIAGLHFDDSQMFEFLREAKKSRKNADKPIICFCSRDTPMSRLIHQSLETSTKAFGAWMYLAEHSYNVYQNPDAELRRVMERCFTEESRKDIQHQRVIIEKQRAELQQLRSLLQGQEWTPEMQEYLDGLQRDLELLLKEIARLHSAATDQGASIIASRDLQDRVSNQVTTTENNMTSTEATQAETETRQSAGEDQLTAKEGIKEAEGHRKLDKLK
jgi:DNA-binding response OmpR family regulator